MPRLVCRGRSLGSAPACGAYRCCSSPWCTACGCPRCSPSACAPVGFQQRVHQRRSLTPANTQTKGEGSGTTHDSACRRCVCAARPRRQPAASAPHLLILEQVALRLEGAVGAQPHIPAWGVERGAPASDRIQAAASRPGAHASACQPAAAGHAEHGREAKGAWCDAGVCVLT